MKIQKFVLGSLLLGMAFSVHAAELSGNITFTSDYDFRGVSQSAGDPAFQASIDLEFDPGFYVGVWGSSIDFDDCCDEDYELNAYGGYYGEFDSGVGYDIGYVQYIYPGASDLDYGEFYVGLEIESFTTYLYYTDDLFGIDENGWYLEGNLDFDLPWWELVMTVHAGYSWGDAYDLENADDTGLTDYIDYSLAVSRYFGDNFWGEIKWVGTDIVNTFKVEEGAFENDSRVIISVGVDFP